MQKQKREGNVKEYFTIKVVKIQWKDQLSPKTGTRKQTTVYIGKESHLQEGLHIAD